MVKVFALIPPRDDISLEEFHSHWISPHGELATGIDTLQRYVQCHRIRPGIEGLGEAEYEGIAEVWFTDVETAAAMGEHPVYAEQVEPDERTFIDQENLAFLFADETVLRDGPAIERGAPTVKMHVLVRRGAGLTPAQFGDRWLGAAGDGGEPFPRAIRHVKALTRAESHAEGEPPADGVEEVWWGSREDFEADWAESRDRYLSDLGGVADLSLTSGFLSEEVRLIWP